MIIILIKLSKLQSNSTSDKGFTLIETLMAMLITTAILSMVASIFLISTASRVQTLQAERAIDIAQGEIDRVQTYVASGVKGTDTTGKVPPVTTGNLTSVSAPTQIVNQRSELTAGKAIKLDADNDGKKDFLIQLFRDTGVTFGSGSAANGELAFFRMGVRVYSLSAESNVGSLQTELASVGFTQGLIDEKEKPLAVLYTEIIRGDSKLSLNQYKQYLSPSPSPSPTPTP